MEEVGVPLGVVSERGRVRTSLPGNTVRAVGGWKCICYGEGRTSYFISESLGFKSLLILTKTIHFYIPLRFLQRVLWFSIYFIVFWQNELGGFNASLFIQNVIFYEMN